MNKLEKLEKRNRLLSLCTSIGVHALLLIMFMLTVAVGAPGPPAAQFGVVVNIGFDDQGSGDIQTDKPVAEEEPQQEPVEQEPQPSEPEPVVEEKPEEKTKEEVVTSKVESPVTVKTKEEKPKEEKPKEEKPKEEKPKEEKPKEEKPKEEVKPKEPEKLKTEYTKENAQTAQKTNSKGETGNSEGDDVNKTGNKGQPDGTLDPNGQYKGTPGGGGGGNGDFLAMSGWDWAQKPSTSGVSNNESGRIVFEIECDEDGEIIKITTRERGVSAATEQLLRQAIQNTSLVKKDTDGKTPRSAKGTVTFVIKSR